MADNKNKNNPQKGNKPGHTTVPNDMPADASNTANFKGAVNKGAEGTKATASQQHGQGSWNAKDDDRRSGSESGSGKKSQDNRSNTGSSKS